MISRHAAEFFIAMGILVVGPLLAFDIGRGEALKQREFLVTSNSPPLILVRAYGDTYILSPVDLTSRTIGHEVVFVKPGPGQPFGFRVMKLGHLRGLAEG
jgi:hypothetical protein